MLEDYNGELNRDCMAGDRTPEQAEIEFNRYMREMGFEPGTHNRAERVDDLSSDSYQSKFPNIDIRHDLNTTPSRWNKDQFRNQRFTEGWTEKKVDQLPGWSMDGDPLTYTNWYRRMVSKS